MAAPDKVAFITGAAGAIGSATARRLAQDGYALALADMGVPAAGSDLPEGLVLDLDVRSGDQVRAAVERTLATYGRIDVLFNCAGYVHSGTILDCDEAAWARSMDLNVSAMYRMIRAFLPGMLARGGGSIINMSSVASSIKGVPNRFAYAASKAAVAALTRSGALTSVACPPPSALMRATLALRRAMTACTPAPFSAQTACSRELPVFMMIIIGFLRSSLLSVVARAECIPRLQV